MTGKVKARICFASLICVMVLLLTSCDFHIMSNREVEEQLEKRYGQKFTVLSSASVTDDYFDNDVYRVKLYIVSPKDDPDTRFYAYNIVEGGFGGVPGLRNSLHDTYVGDTMGAAFLEQATDTALQYQLDYTCPIKSSSEYHSCLWISFDPVFPEDLTEISELLSRTFTDTLEKIPGAQDGWVSIQVRIWYREHDWPDEEYCLIWIEPFTQYKWNKETGKNEPIPFDPDADAIREYILGEVGKYKERLQQTIKTIK